MTRRSSGMRLKYEPEYDLLSVWVGDPQPVDQIEVEPGVYVRVSRAGHEAVGLEVLEAASKFHRDEATLGSPAFARQLLAKYGPKATTAFHPAY